MPTVISLTLILTLYIAIDSPLSFEIIKESCNARLNSLANLSEGKNAKQYLREVLNCLDRLNYPSSASEVQSLNASYQKIDDLVTQKVVPSQILETISINSRQIEPKLYRKNDLPFWLYFGGFMWLFMSSHIGIYQLLNSEYFYNYDDYNHRD